MRKTIMSVLKRIGSGLEAANSNGAMGSTEQKKRIMLGLKQAPTHVSQRKNK